MPRAPRPFARHRIPTDAPAPWHATHSGPRGIRGELSVIVKVEYIRDANKFAESSMGVLFFSRSSFPDGYQVRGAEGRRERDGGTVGPEGRRDGGTAGPEGRRDGGTGGTEGR